MLRAISVALQLIRLQLEIELEGATGIRRIRRLGHRRARDPTEELDLFGQDRRAWFSSWVTWARNSSTVLMYSAPLMIAMCCTYCTIERNSVSRSSLSNFDEFGLFHHEPLPPVRLG